MLGLLSRRFISRPFVRLCSSLPKRYTKDHEWIKPIGNNKYQMGLTSHALEQMGEIVFMDHLREEDADVEKEDVILEMESVKATSSIFAPCDLTITQIDRSVLDDLSIITDENWLFEFTTKTKLEDETMDEKDYEKHCE